MKLEGLRVLDLSLFLPGPHLTMMMADHGAEVIKVEPPAGEPVREVGLRQNGHSVWFRNTHRGKRCIALNLKAEGAREALLALALRADVFVESFRPGVADRLGIGYEALRAVNPRLVYCSISAFGQTGPMVANPAHDIGVQAEAGLVSVNLGPDGEPAMPGVPAADMAASLMALSGILMALLRRERTGQGDYLDIAMYDSLLAWTPNVMGPPFAAGRAPVPKDERSWGGSAFAQIYRTADGRHLVLAGAEHKFVLNLLGALGRPDLVPLATQAPGPAQEPVRAFLREAFATRTLAAWSEFLAAMDLAWAPVRTLHEAVTSEQARAREMVVEQPAGQPHLGLPIKFRHEPGRIDPALDALGASTLAVLKEAGFDDARLQALQASGALPSVPPGEPMSLQGQRIVVTGAAGGVGRALVDLLIADGAQVCASDLAIDPGSFPSGGPGRLTTIAGDVSRAADVDAIFSHAEGEFGGVDALVSNAGFLLVKSAHETSEDDWDAVMNANAKGLFLLARRALPAMLQRRRGTIVATGSTSSVVGLPQQAAYAAAKGAVLQLVRQMAIDYAPHGIRVNAVGPAAIDTPFLQRYLDGLDDPVAGAAAVKAAHPLGRWAQPREVAQAIRFLLGPDSSFVTGHLMMVDGGYTAR